jgi:hypothetical protein
MGSSLPTRLLLCRRVCYVGVFYVVCCCLCDGERVGVGVVWGDGVVRGVSVKGVGDVVGGVVGVVVLVVVGDVDGVVGQLVAVDGEACEAERHDHARQGRKGSPRQTASRARASIEKGCAGPGRCGGGRANPPRRWGGRALVVPARGTWRRNPRRAPPGSPRQKSGTEARGLPSPSPKR